MKKWKARSLSGLLAASLIQLPAVPVYAADADLEPVLAVSFDDGTATDTRNGQNGTISGDVTFEQGVKGKAVHMVNPDSGDGVDAKQFIQFPQSDLLKFGSEDFTLSFWYRTGKTVTIEGAAISNKDWYSGYNNGFCLGQMKQGMSINFRAADSSGRKDTSREGAISDGSWHHVAAVFDRDSNMTLYCDGSAIASTDISDQAGMSIDTGLPLVLGANGMLQNGIEDSWFDELKVYRRVLSESEIRAEIGTEALKIKLADYRKKAAESDASQQRKDVFEAKCDEIETALSADSPDAVALELELIRAWNALTGPEDGLYSFEVISDTHIPNSDPSDATNAKLIDAFNDLKRDYPQTNAVLNGGDFSRDGSASQMEGYFSCIEPFKNDFRILTALGNHDVRWQSGWDEVRERYLRLNKDYMPETDGKVYYDQWIDNAHYIILNTEWDLKDRAFLSKEQLSWLDEKLAESDVKNVPSFVVLHQALGNTYLNSTEWSVGVQEDNLRDVLKKHNGVFLFTGHIHDGVGAIDVTHNECGVQVDIPGMRDNDYGDGRGALGWHVTVYEDSVRLDLRDYAANEWVEGYSQTFALNDLKARGSDVLLDVDFDDQAATDDSGNGHHGTITGNVTFVDDEKGGKAVRIENDAASAGTSAAADSYIDFGDSIAFGTDDFTVSFRYLADLDVVENAILSNKDWRSGGNSGFTIADFNQSNRGMTLNFRANGGDARKDTSRVADSQDGQWHDAVAVFDRDGEMALYLDGDKKASTDISAQKDLSIDVDGGHLVLGADGFFCDGARSIVVDDLKIERRALGSREVEGRWDPYTVTTGEDSVTISWDQYYDGVRPAKAVLNGEIAQTIAVDAKSVTFDGLKAGKTYTLGIVNVQTDNAANFRDMEDWTIIMPGQPEESEARKQLKAALEQARGLDLEALEGLGQSAKQALLDQIAASQTLLDQPDADDEGMNTARSALEKAMRLAQLDPAKNALQALIDQASQLQESDYTEPSWSALENALHAARAAIADPETMSEQGIADAADALADAIKVCSRRQNRLS